jgi:putative heme-binding domain-containing protein
MSQQLDPTTALLSAASQLECIPSALKTAIRFWLIGLTLACGRAELAMAQPLDPAKNPYTSEKDIRQGRLAFNGFCSRCHGMDAKGAKGPNLTTGRFRHGSTDAAILANIKNGIRGTGMPGFPVDDEFLWPIVGFLRAAQKAAAAPAEQAPANRQRGRELFVELKCSSCHWTGGDGGRRGPDLSRWRGDEQFFHRAIADPDQEIDPRYEQVKLRLKDGRPVSGLRLYEDSYYLLLIDDQEVLRTISLDDVEERAGSAQSLMPKPPRPLTAAELRDLADYVNSLSKEIRP